MIIKVKQEHIDRGCRFDSYSCPIALAMQEVGLYNPSVGDAHAYWGVRRVHAALPDWVQKWVVDFDNQCPVLSIEFDLPAARTEEEP